MSPCPMDVNEVTPASYLFFKLYVFRYIFSLWDNEIKNDRTTKCSAMVPWWVVLEFYLRSTFSFAGQDTASEAHHCRNTNVTANDLITSAWFRSSPTNFSPIRNSDKKNLGLIMLHSDYNFPFVGSFTKKPEYFSKPARSNPLSMDPTS